MMTKARVIFVLVILSATSVPSFALEPAVVEDAKYQELTVADNSTEEPSALVLKLQILLDRAHFSPGIIDGRMGDNTVYALREFERRVGLPADGHLDLETWTRLSQNSPKVLVTYTVKAKDIAGPFAESIPDDYAAMAEMERLPYTSVWELLSEKFHVDIELLKSLNPIARLDKAGEKIVVPNVVDAAPKGKLERIEVDKDQGVLRGYGEDGKVSVVYPASIGSNENPSPSGKMTVKGVARNPKYSYRPAKNFQQKDNDEPLTLPPGPNGPVGSIWIDLTKDTYGIHGTAQPELVGKTSSHGCARLTNWDAEELGRVVKFGTPVIFLD
jgi:lipoprotein-anchoring transpeptidase ErfK/SrfK